MTGPEPARGDRIAPQESHNSATVTPTWVLSPSATAGILVAVTFAALGLLFARIDVALFAVPIVAALALAWDRRPDPTQPSTVSAQVTIRPGEVELDYTVTLSAPDHVEAVVLRMATLIGQSRQIVIDRRTAGELTGQIPLLHSGPQELLRIEYMMLGVDATTVSRPTDPMIVRRVVSPPYQAISQLPLPGRLYGLTGTHDSSRAGDGGDFRDVHPFTAGDRLRRIDWKATARRGQFAGDLYVRRTAALSDATVLIVMDSRDDAGEQVAEWSRNVPASKGISALDIAREAASSIAAGYIRAGDRVGFQDLSSRSRMIPHASGSRHLWRLLRAIEITAPSAVPFLRRRPPIVPSGALVFVLSSFLDDQVIGLAGQWRGAGHRVIAVDILPAPRFARAGRAVRLAHRIVMIERDHRLQTLAATGVEVLRWPEDSDTVPRAARLRALARSARRQR